MDLFDEIKAKLNPSDDYKFLSIKKKFKLIRIIYNEVLTDSLRINEYIMEKILIIPFWRLNNLENKIPDCHIKTISYDNIINYLNDGYVVIILDKIYAIEMRANLDRGITDIKSELSLGGPKDSFSEIYNTNLGLIRRRIKDENLKVYSVSLGKYTKTRVGVLYVENIVHNNLVNNIIDKLNNINIDGVFDSSYLKETLENPFNLFPTIIMTERPDKCSMALLEGKVVIIVDNSPYALILPSFLLDFFHTTDDYYQKSFNASFIRIIRVMAFFISIFIPAIYISVTTRDYSLVPLPLLLMLKAGRTYVPFPAYIEALFMIICFEILKESDLRMSTTSGSAVSILGGLILGDAAVAAGIVSPIMIIIIAISSIAGLIFNSVELSNTLRTYKIFLLFLGTIFGIYGVLLGATIMIHNIYTTKIFGYSYLYFDKNEVFDSIMKIDRRVKRRNSKLTNNVVRGWFR